MSNLAAIVADLKQKWDELKALLDTSETTLAGIPARIEEAVAAAKAAGATPEELQALTDLAAAISTESAELSAALASQAPPADPPADPPPDNGPEA